MTVLEKQDVNAAMALLVEIDGIKTQMDSLHEQMLVTIYEKLIKPNLLNASKNKPKLVRIK
jgi:hypothetical protein